MKNIKAYLSILNQVHKPAQYLGNEINVIQKKITPSLLRIALCYPDTYELGIGNLSFRILYHLLNQTKNIFAERVFLPEIDMQQLLLKHKIPLFALETHSSLRDFDFIGFTLQTELHITNVLQTLKLSRMKVRKQQRKGFPLVIGGGPSLVNPEPYVDFFDFFVIGDAEIVLPKIISVYDKKMNRAEYLKSIRHFDGVYIPEFGKYKVTVARVPDLNAIDFPVKQLVPLIHTSNNRGIVELDRGCLNNCRFCQAGYFYRPLRARTVDNILKLSKQLIYYTGFDDISLLSLSISNYDNLPFLLQELHAMFPYKNINFSLPSLRIDAFGTDIIEKFQSRKKTGLTFALESMSPKVRKFLNKDFDYQNFLHIIRQVVEKGWRRFKVYLMFGFPVEDEIEENIKGILEFSDFVRQLDKRVSIVFHLTPFIPKPNTPFQWLNQKNRDDLQKDLNRIRRSIKRKNVQIKWHDIRMAYLEFVLATSDREFGSAIYKVWKKGAYFDTWDDKFRFDLWEPKVKTYKREKKVPWAHIDFGYEEEFFKNEFEKSQQLEETVNCKTNPCYACGVCYKKKIQNIFESPKPYIPTGSIDKREQQKNIFFVFVVFTKLNNIKYLSQLDVLSVFDKAFNAIDIPVRMSEGFSPHKKFSFFNPVPLGVESQKEIMLVQLTDKIDLLTYQRKLNEFLPEGMTILNMEYKENKKIFSQIQYFQYVVKIKKILQSQKTNIITHKDVVLFQKIDKMTYRIKIRFAISLKKFLITKIKIKEKNIISILKTDFF